MSRRWQRRVPGREQVFIMSLMYHGFRPARRRVNLKKKKGYVISSSGREDAFGIDLWVKMPGHTTPIPVQITQRGVRLFRKHHKNGREQLCEFIRRSESRIRAKRLWCRLNRIAFVVVRDFDGSMTNKAIALSDIKALRYAVRNIKAGSHKYMTAP